MANKTAILALAGTIVLASGAYQAAERGVRAREECVPERLLRPLRRPRGRQRLAALLHAPGAGQPVQILPQGARGGGRGDEGRHPALSAAQEPEPAPLTSHQAERQAGGPYGRRARLSRPSLPLHGIHARQAPGACLSGGDRPAAEARPAIRELAAEPSSIQIDSHFSHGRPRRSLSTLKQNSPAS